jgi:hypothetical protein
LYFFFLIILFLSNATDIIWASFTLWRGIPEQALPYSVDWTIIWVYTLITTIMLPIVVCFTFHSAAWRTPDYTTSYRISPISVAQDIPIRVLPSFLLLVLAVSGIVQWASTSDDCKSFLEAEYWDLFLNFKIMVVIMCLGFAAHAYLLISTSAAQSAGRSTKRFPTGTTTTGSAGWRREGRPSTCSRCLQRRCPPMGWRVTTR